jgi:hypothetical protein
VGEDGGTAGRGARVSADLPVGCGESGGGGGGSNLVPQGGSAYSGGTVYSGTENFSSGTPAYPDGQDLEALRFTEDKLQVARSRAPSPQAGLSNA